MSALVPKAKILVLHIGRNYGTRDRGREKDNTSRFFLSWCLAYHHTKQWSHYYWRWQINNQNYPKINEERIGGGNDITTYGFHDAFAPVAASATRHTKARNQTAVSISSPVSTRTIQPWLPFKSSKTELPTLMQELDRGSDKNACVAFWTNMRAGYLIFYV